MPTQIDIPVLADAILEAANHFNWLRRQGRSEKEDAAARAEVVAAVRALYDADVRALRDRAVAAGRVEAVVLALDQVEQANGALLTDAYSPLGDPSRAEFDADALETLRVATLRLRAAEAAAGPGRPPPPPPSRLTFDDQRQVVTLDGEEYLVGDAAAYRVYRTIADAGLPGITKARISLKVPGTAGRKTVPRLITKLPKTLEQTIDRGGAGFRIRLP
jgi:hypothetical protein